MVQKTLFLILGEVINETTSTLKSSQVSFNWLAKVVMDAIMDLDFLSAGQGVVCVITNTSYGTSINALNQVEKSIKKCKENSTWLCKVDWRFWDLLSWLN